MVSLANALATSTLVAAPVVDIDGTLFVQAGIFLTLMFVLNGVLFRPWLATLERRSEAIGGSLVKAKALREDARVLASDYDQKIAATRERAADLRAQAHRQEEETRARDVATARTEAAAELDAARDRVRQEATTARETLGTRIDALAEDIATKVLGRVS